MWSACSIHTAPRGAVRVVVLLLASLPFVGGCLATRGLYAGTIGRTEPGGEEPPDIREIVRARILEVDGDYRIELVVRLSGGILCSFASGEHSAIVEMLNQDTPHATTLPSVVVVARNPGFGLPSLWTDTFAIGSLVSVPDAAGTLAPGSTPLTPSQARESAIIAVDCLPAMGRSGLTVWTFVAPNSGRQLDRTPLLGFEQPVRKERFFAPAQRTLMDWAEFVLIAPFTAVVDVIGFPIHAALTLSGDAPFPFVGP